MTATKKMIWGNEVEAKVGCFVRPDEWNLGNRLEASDWEGGQFRLPTFNTLVKSLCVNITITGRSWQRTKDGQCVRVQIEFVGDGEPSTFCSGWMHD